MARRKTSKPRELTASLVQRGLRVQSTHKHSRDRIGMLTGTIDHGYPRPRVEVIPEGLSLARLETWAIHETVILPIEQQVKALGGSFDPPKGYPLITQSKPKS